MLLFCLTDVLEFFLLLVIEVLEERLLVRDSNEVCALTFTETSCALVDLCIFNDVQDVFASQRSGKLICGFFTSTKASFVGGATT